MTTTVLGVCPEPEEERRRHDPDARHDERHSHHPAGPGGPAPVRSEEDPPADALGGLRFEPVQAGAEGRAGGLAQRSASGAAPSAPGDDPEVRMTIVQHLDELRTRILRSLVALLATVTVAMIFYKDLISIA